MPLNDKQIREHCKNSEFQFNNRPLIDPFSEPVQNGISYGLTSAGYDARLDGQVLIYKLTRWQPIDPKMFKDEAYRKEMFDEYNATDRIILPGGKYALVQTVETFCLPRWLKGRCVGKSTYARCGLVVNTTPLEPEWYGKLTVEVYACVPIVLYVGEGVCQLEFEQIGPCETSYADKHGKYQDQRTVTPARVK